MKFETNDIASAAFLLLKGFKLESAIDDGKKYVFIFDDPNSLAQLTCIQYINSECSAFDNHMRGLRSVLRSRKK